MKERVILIAPERIPPGDAASVGAAAARDISRLTSAYGLPPLDITTLREGDEAAIVVGDSRRSLAGDAAVMPTQAAYVARFATVMWRALLAPALAGHGVTPGWWLRHAARRGHALDALARLARGGASDEIVALRLAELPMPVPALAGGDQAIVALSDTASRRQAAQAASEDTGLPVVIPTAPEWDAGCHQNELALLLGAWHGPGFAPDALAGELARLAPAFVDPASLVAMLTDEARFPRRLAALALAELGPVPLARRVVEFADSGAGRVNLRAMVEAALGVTPAQ